MKQRFLYAMLVLLVLAPCLQAQQRPPIIIANESSEVMLLRVSATSRCQEACVVRDAPYSAERVWESVQLLADGNRITRTTSEELYRDSAGRTRSESSWLDSQLVQIKDPVLGVTYRLYPADKAGLKMATGTPDSPGSSTSAPQSGASAGAAKAAEQLAPTLALAMAASQGERTSRSLGTRQIEGLTAEGTLTTSIIPAGRYGNALPIVSTTESWYAPQLKLEVYAKSSNPLNGESVSRIQKLRRGEPAASLFTAPADYTVREIPRR